ncbi:MAG TPA: CapA family protein [Acidimicrobiales bacterium]
MRLALAGDTMLGREVGRVLAADPGAPIFDEGVRAVAAEADLFVANLECAVSDRGERWPDPDKPFFFRAPPVAAEVLADLGVDCVTLANNHALDYGADALLDTLAHLDAAGIAAVGAGADEATARAPAVLRAGALAVGVVPLTDHPVDYAAGPARPGVAYADLRRGVPTWVTDAIAGLGTDVVVAAPHWGPNMVAEPVGHVRAAAAVLRSAGATLVAGHSAHVFHGVDDRVLYDLGDFVDDYAAHPVLRNDLGLLFLVTFDGATPVALEAVPLALDFCRTRLAADEDAAWVRARFRAACAAFGTRVGERDGRVTVELQPAAPSTRVPSAVT